LCHSFSISISFLFKSEFWEKDGEFLSFEFYPQNNKFDVDLGFIDYGGSGSRTIDFIAVYSIAPEVWSGQADIKMKYTLVFVDNSPATSSSFSTQTVNILSEIGDTEVSLLPNVFKFLICYSFIVMINNSFYFKSYLWLDWRLQLNRRVFFIPKVIYNFRMISITLLKCPPSTMMKFHRKRIFISVKYCSLSLIELYQLVLIDSNLQTMSHLFPMGFTINIFHYMITYLFMVILNTVTKISKLCFFFKKKNLNIKIITLF
jgi:hypothetical protein